MHEVKRDSRLISFGQNTDKSIRMSLAYTTGPSVVVLPFLRRYAALLLAAFLTPDFFFFRKCLIPGYSSRNSHAMSQKCSHLNPTRKNEEKLKRLLFTLQSLKGLPVPLLAGDISPKDSTYPMKLQLQKAEALPAPPFCPSS